MLEKLLHFISYFIVFAVIIQILDKLTIFLVSTIEGIDEFLVLFTTLIMPVVILVGAGLIKRKYGFRQALICFLYFLAIDFSWFGSVANAPLCYKTENTNTGMSSMNCPE